MKSFERARCLPRSVTFFPCPFICFPIPSFEAPKNPFSPPPPPRTGRPPWRSLPSLGAPARPWILGRRPPPGCLAPQRLRGSRCRGPTGAAGRRAWRPPRGATTARASRAARPRSVVTANFPALVSHWMARMPGVRAPKPSMWPNVLPPRPLHVLRAGRASESGARALPTHTLTRGLTIPRTSNSSLCRLLSALAAVPAAVLAQGRVRRAAGHGAGLQNRRPKGKYSATMCATPASSPRTDVMVRLAYGARSACGVWRAGRNGLSQCAPCSRAAPTLGGLPQRPAHPERLGLRVPRA